MIDPYKNFEPVVLPNGLTIYVSYQPECVWESVGFLIHSGAEQDPVGLEGVAHFVEHVVSENAAIPKKEIQAFFGKHGGSINLGVTSYDKTAYTIFTSSNEMLLGQAFSIMGPMLLSALLVRSMERERQVIIQEFSRYYPQKFSFARQTDLRRQKALYSGFWLERFLRPLGAPESIKKITQDDLQCYYNTHYTPANMSIVCVGGATLESIVEILSANEFGKEKEGSRTSCPIPITKINLPAESKYRNRALSVVRRVITNTGSYESYAKVPLADNESTMSIVTEMLTRVLNEEVRERRGWTYHIDANHYNHRHFFEFEISCNSFAGSAFKDIGKVIEECIAGLHTRQGLFEEVKQVQASRNTLTDLSGKDVLRRTIDSLAKRHRIRTITEINDDISRVTMGDVKETLRWLTPERRWTCIL